MAPGKKLSASLGLKRELKENKMPELAFLGSSFSVRGFAESAHPGWSYFVLDLV